MYHSLGKKSRSVRASEACFQAKNSFQALFKVESNGHSLKTLMYCSGCSHNWCYQHQQHQQPQMQNWWKCWRCGDTIIDSQKDSSVLIRHHPSLTSALSSTRYQLLSLESSLIAIVINFFKTKVRPITSTSYQTTQTDKVNYKPKVSDYYIYCDFLHHCCFIK